MLGLCFQNRGFMSVIKVIIFAMIVILGFLFLGRFFL